MSSRVLLDKALSNFDSLSSAQLDRLTSVLGTLGMLVRPTANNIRQTVLAAARFQLLDVSMPFIMQIKSGISPIYRDTFWSTLTVDSIDQLFKKQLPTPVKVSKILVCASESLTNAEDNCLFYLQQFVRNMDQEDLTSFLHFVTGSTVMPTQITVSFNNLVGIMRRPVAHTCSNVLELPSSYTSMQDMKREFLAIIRDTANFQMDIA